MAGHHSSTHYVRTQSQEYLRTLKQDQQQLQQMSTNVGKRHQQTQDRNQGHVGVAVTTTGSSKMSINGQGNLFEHLQRKQKLPSARPHQIQLVNQKHAHIQRLLQQQQDQMNLLQFSTPQQGKNPFIPSPQTINGKGGTQLDQIRKLGSEPSGSVLRADQIRQQLAQTNQRQTLNGQRQPGGASVLVQYPIDGLHNTDDQAILNVMNQQNQGYGVVDKNTAFTSNNQNRQIRVVSKKQLKSMHYQYQPVLNSQVITSNPNATVSVAQQNQQQVINQQQLIASKGNMVQANSQNTQINNPQAASFNVRGNGSLNAIPLRQSAKEKQTSAQRQIDVFKYMQGPQSVNHSSAVQTGSPLKDFSKIYNNQNVTIQLNRSIQNNQKDILSPHQSRAQINPKINRQFSPNGREGSEAPTQNGMVSGFTSSGLEYLANIANIAQTSPQYVLDKNAIKAEIVNQAAIAARSNNIQQKSHAGANHYDASNRLNHMLFENLMLGSSISANSNLSQPPVQNAHQRYEQQEKLIKAFRHVVATGNVDQLSGIEMLKRWQVLYGQAQKEGVNIRNRNQQRLDAHRSATGALRINSTDGSIQNFGQSSQAENLIQNIKISQLNQISAVLDQQTAKLIAQTQSLMSKGDTITQGVLTADQLKDLQRTQQDVILTMQQYRPGARYRSSYSGIHQKHYDRQRMLDFYSQIRLGDLDDQAKIRSQAIKQAPPLDPNKLRYSVLNGNNSRLIKNAMARRKDFWLETTNSDPHFHFKWQPCSHGMKFDLVGKDIAPEVHPCQKQIVNHFENHGCISEKSKLFLNLSEYVSKKLNENVFDFLPLTFFVECDLSKQKQYSKSMVQFMNAFYALDDIKKRTKKFYQKLDSEQGFAGNNFEKNALEQIDRDNDQCNLGVASTNVKDQLLDDNFIFKHFYQNKILLIRQHKKEEREEKEAYMEALGANLHSNSNTKSMKRLDLVSSSTMQTKLASSHINKAGAQEASNIESCENFATTDNKSPNTSAILQKQTQNKILKKYFHRQSMPFCHYSGHNLWILKATKLNQGQGIHVCNNLPQIKTLIQRYCEGFPKKYSENFTYEKELQNQKKVAKVNDSNPVSQNEGTNKNLNSSGNKKGHSKLEKNESIQNDQELIDEEDEPLDDEFEEESPLIADSSSKKKKHFSNSKLSYSVPASKLIATNTAKIDGINQNIQNTSNTNSRSKQKKAEQSNNQSNKNDDDFQVNRKKDSQTPRADSRGRKHRGMLSPKQNQNAFGALDLDQAKSGEKHRHLNSTLPEYLQQVSNQKPINQSEPKYKHNSFIIQKYIERPLLIDDRKFDIRVWVFLDSKGNAYICKPGYLRTSSYKFELDPDDPDNRFVHLTNIAVQKYSQDFGAHEDGNILNFDQFEQYVHKKWPQRNFSIQRDLIFKIRQQIARTLFTSRKLMDSNKRINQSFQNSNFFELFGYDFMIDEDFNVWLIECNTNPSLAESAKYLEQLIPRMIEDMIKLTIDEEFMYYYKQIIQVNKQLIAQTEDPAELPDDLADQSCLDNLLAIQSPSLLGYSDNENVWEKLFNLNNRSQRKEAKIKYNVPIEMNSKYAFNIKNRDFKIKKYINYRSQLEQAMCTVAAASANILVKHQSSQSVNKQSQSPNANYASQQHSDEK